MKARGTRRHRFVRRIATAALALALASSGGGAAAASRPNILVIVADDLGFSDLGAFGGEIGTPNLDALARRGVRFTDFHAAPACSPTRAMLLTGTDPHRVGLGAMEMRTPNQVGTRGNEGYLRPDNATLAERLSAAGYSTMFSGKWHLGAAVGQDPHDRGFRRSVAMLPAAHNHFGTDVSNDRVRGVVYTEDGRVLPSLPEDFYSSDYFATRLIGFLDEPKHGGTRDAPFFAYLAFSAPHAPLQAPPAAIARYKGVYDAGFDVVRARRLSRQAVLELRDPATPAHPRVKPPLGWAALSPADKARSAREMEVYAAMVSTLDQNVGRVVAALKRSGRLDDTIILFLSDNGAEGMDFRDTELASMHRRGAAADNRLPNLGAATSFAAYGPGWASAATAPSWLYKTYATEGGTRVPAFIVGPRALTGPARIDRAFVTAADIAPTVLELAGVAADGDRFEGRVVEPITGTSMASHLAGRTTAVHGEEEAFGTELFGSRSIRKGRWKITDTGDGVWHLFDLAGDPGETADLAAAQPARLAELRAAWDAYAARVGVVMPTKRFHTP